MLSLPKPATRGRGRAHRVFHPLSGADLATLVRVLSDGGAVPLSRLHVPLLALGSALARWPFGLAESLACRLAVDFSQLPAPIFVVGYWRSGTTHLSNVLSQWQGVGILPPINVGMPHEALGLARLVRPFIEQFYPKTRLIDDVPLGSELPQEDELALANMSPLSFYHGIYFPRQAPRWIERGLFFDDAEPADIEHWKRSLHTFVSRMTVHQNRRPLLIRNPAHCSRIGLLRSIWPDAKFIHIYRNPYVVHASATRLFSTLLKELAVQHHDVDADDLVMRTYPRMLGDLLREAEQIPPGQYAEVQFETFEKQPYEELRRIFNELQMDGFEQAKPSFEAYLNSVKSYRKAEHRFEPDVIDKIQEEWRSVLDRWTYATPRYSEVIAD